MGEPNHIIRWSRVLSFVFFYFLVVRKTLFALWLLLISVLMFPGVTYHNPKIAFLVKVSSKPIIFFLKLGVPGIILYWILSVFSHKAPQCCKVFLELFAVSSYLFNSKQLSTINKFCHLAIQCIHNITDTLNVRHLDAVYCEMPLEMTLHGENDPALCLLPVHHLFCLFFFLCKGCLNVFRHYYSKELSWESFGSVNGLYQLDLPM